MPHSQALCPLFRASQNIHELWQIKMNTIMTPNQSGMLLSLFEFIQY